MPGRFQRTHRLSAVRQEQVDEDEYESPIYDETDVLGGDAGDPEPVRYMPEGTTYVRGETGERVQRAPRLKGGPGLTELAEGDVLTLEPVAPGGATVSNIEVRSIDPQYGRRGQVESVIVELEDV